MEQLFSREPVGEFDPCLVESLPIPAWGEMLESAYRCKVLLVGMAGAYATTRGSDGRVYPLRP